MKTYHTYTLVFNVEWPQSTSSCSLSARPRARGLVRDAPLLAVEAIAHLLVHLRLDGERGALDGAPRELLRVEGHECLGRDALAVLGSVAVLVLRVARSAVEGLGGVIGGSLMPPPVPCSLSSTWALRLLIASW